MKVPGGFHCFGEIAAAITAVMALAVACTTSTTADERVASTVPTSSTTAGTRPDETVLSPGDHTFTLAHGGRDRSYLLHIPNDVRVPAALMVALHGGGGTGEGFQKDNGMDVVADRERFIVVYPEGTGVLPNRLHTWNSGYNCCGYSLDNDIDDVGFLRTVIEDVGERTPIDRGRAYMTGHSNGAMMAYRFAAEAADMVTAIAPVAGALSVKNPTPSEPVALLHIHSADDPRALYEGGEGPPFPGTSRTHVAAPVLPGIDTWASLNGCDPTTTVTDAIVGADDSAGERVDRLAWACPEGAQVEHLRLAGTGHGWPGVTVPRIWQRQLGPPTSLVNASEEVWSFVSRFSR